MEPVSLCPHSRRPGFPVRAARSPTTALQGRCHSHAPSTSTGAEAATAPPRCGSLLPPARALSTPGPGRGRLGRWVSKRKGFLASKRGAWSGAWKERVGPRGSGSREGHGQASGPGSCSGQPWLAPRTSAPWAQGCQAGSGRSYFGDLSHSNETPPPAPYRRAPGLPLQLRVAPLIRQQPACPGAAAGSAAAPPRTFAFECGWGGAGAAGVAGSRARLPRQRSEKQGSSADCCSISPRLASETLRRVKRNREAPSFCTLPLRRVLWDPTTQGGPELIGASLSH